MKINFRINKNGKEEKISITYWELIKLYIIGWISVAIVVFLIEMLVLLG